MLYYNDTLFQSYDGKILIKQMFKLTKKPLEPL